MKHDYENEELIDLGAATDETKGTPYGVDELGGTFIPGAGLSDE